MNTNFNPQLYAKRMEINALKRLLKQSDYKAIKYAEGLISAEDYQSIKEERQSWRNQINLLEAECTALLNNSVENNEE